MRRWPRSSRWASRGWYATPQVRSPCCCCGRCWSNPCWVTCPAAAPDRPVPAVRQHLPLPRRVMAVPDVCHALGCRGVAAVLRRAGRCGVRRRGRGSQSARRVSDERTPMTDLPPPAETVADAAPPRSGCAGLGTRGRPSGVVPARFSGQRVGLGPAGTAAGAAGAAGGGAVHARLRAHRPGRRRGLPHRRADVRRAGRSPPPRRAGRCGAGRTRLGCVRRQRHRRVPDSPFAAHITLAVPPVAAINATREPVGRQLQMLPRQLRNSWYIQFFQLPGAPSGCCPHHPQALARLGAAGV